MKQGARTPALVRRWERERRIVLRPDRRRFLLLLALSLGLAAMGLWLCLRADDLWTRIIGWLNVVLFGLGTLAFAAQLVPGANSLTLDPQGFTVVSLWRSRRHRWDEVEAFQVQPVGHQVLILFDVPGNDGRGAGLNRALYGASHGLPDSYGLRPEQLAVFLALVRAWAADRQA